MFFELLKQDKYLTLVIVVVALIWLFVLLKNVFMVNKSAGEFQQQYQRILDADEYKVKGKFEN